MTNPDAVFNQHYITIQENEQDVNMIPMLVGKKTQVKGSFFKNCLLIFFFFSLIIISF